MYLLQNKKYVYLRFLEHDYSWLLNLDPFWYAKIQIKYLYTLLFILVKRKFPEVSQVIFYDSDGAVLDEDVLEEYIREKGEGTLLIVKDATEQTIYLDSLDVSKMSTITDLSTLSTSTSNTPDVSDFFLLSPSSSNWCDKVKDTVPVKKSNNISANVIIVFLVRGTKQNVLQLNLILNMYLFVGYHYIRMAAYISKFLWTNITNS